MTQTEFQVGDLIENRYCVLSVLGSGGMGTLYRVADQTDNGTVVALKTVRLDIPIAERPGRIDSFQREFRLLTQLHHPNLVEVFSYGVTGAGDLYYTMEWVQGRDLENQIDRLDFQLITPLIIQICRALAYLHARQVIHGDLKPANVLLAGHQVKIVDFGVALEARQMTDHSRYHTPGYTAPEVIQRRPVDHRIDLYSLGAIWYTFILGEPPLFMPDPGVERLIQLRLFESLDHQNEAAQAVIPVISRLLSSSPEDRYASANEVIAVVGDVTGEPHALETRETARSYALRSRFVGHEVELEQLLAAWNRALRVEGNLVVISGESGVGKTRLVEEFGVQAQLKGARLAWGRCVEGEKNAYHPWREVLRVLVRYVEEKNEQEMRQVGPVLATLLPELWLRSYMADLTPPSTLEPAAAQQRLHNVIIRMVRAAAAERPTVIIIENAHWADEGTLALLGVMRRVVGPAWLLICVTYREEEVGPEHPLTLLTGKRVQRIRLRSLSPEATTELVHSMLGLSELPEFLVQRVQQITNGNAFFVQELIRSWAESEEVLQRTLAGWQVNQIALEKAELSESIQQVVWQRLSRLSEQAQTLLRCAALVGPVFWDRTLGEICRVPGTRVQRVLQEVLEKELVFEREHSTFAGAVEYIFAQSAVREVSYERTSAQERSKYHARIAEWLLAHSDEQVSEHLGLVANHLEKAGQREPAIHYLRRAGEQAAARFANLQAVAYFNRAIALTSNQAYSRRYDLRLACDNIYDLQSEREQQAENLADLAVLAEVLEDDQRRAEVALRRANHALMTGDYPTTVTTVQTAIHLAQAVGDQKIEAKGFLHWAQAFWYQGDYQAAQSQLKQALKLASDLPEIETQCLRDLGTVSYLMGDYAGAKDYYQQSLNLCHRLGSRQGESSALNGLGIVAEHQGDFLESKFYHEESLHICREIGFRQGEGNALVDLGNVFLGWGDYEAARKYYEQALEVYREIDDRQGEGLVLGNIGLLLHQTGNDELACEYGRQALDIAQEIGDRSGEGFVFTGLGHAQVALGNLAEATESYQEALAVRRELDEQNLIMETLAGLARVSLRRDEPATALLHVEEIMAHLDQFSQDSGHQGLDGTEEPFRIYLTCYQVLKANQDPRAPEILNTAHTLLQGQALRLDLDVCHSFLENVVVHREILAEFSPEKKDEHSI